MYKDRKERSALTDIIEVKNVTKKIKGKTVLDGITINIKENKVYGFSGPNGSGKSMTFKAILGFVNPNVGEVIVNGKKVRKDELFAKDIGFSMDIEGILPNFTGFKNLKLLSLLNSFPISDEDIKGILKYVGLNPDEDRKVKHYSLGMKQRLCIGQALLNDSTILMFDEPDNALDENGQIFLEKMILEQKEKGKTILVSSHDKYFLNKICDYIYVFSEGNANLKEMSSANE